MSKWKRKAQQTPQTQQEWQVGDKGIATSGKNAYYAVVTMLGPLDGMVCVDISYPDARSGKVIVVPNELPACNLRRPLPEERAR